MGNIFSSASARDNEVVAREKFISVSDTMENTINGCENSIIDGLKEISDNDDVRSKQKEQEMNEFRKQLTIKRAQRREILSRHKAEKIALEKSLENEIKSKLEVLEKNKIMYDLLIKNKIDVPEELDRINWNSEFTQSISQMKDEVQILKVNNYKLRCELASTNNTLQTAYSDIADLTAQNSESIKQIKSLKEVITVSKTMINLREEQLNELKNKLSEIEQSLADRETHILSTDLRQEYERQLQNIRTLRGLYEERARLAEVTRQALVRELQEQKELNQAEIKKCNDLNIKIEELESAINILEENIKDKNIEIATCRDETSCLKAEMEVINKLFSQVLLGYKTKQDLDKLVNRLEQHHGILTHMAERENGSESSSALPKLLLQLISQVEETEGYKQENESTNKTKSTEENVNEENTDIRNSIPAKAEEIVENLPKVWKVLMELLSHQIIPEQNEAPKVTTCYKSVETRSGPVLVPSVSQTYIRLKDLIIEKLSLIKEVNRMKQLNGHLETRLQEQERRLCLVTTELSKTWHVVGRLRRHHHQLHTHEKILKYELQQKRKLLNELKEELEYCREKWEQAREKNSQSEKDWKKLRAEFSNRKTKSVSYSINNSAESGYSDERPSDDSSESNDESEYINEPQVRCKKKIKKSFETAIDSSADFNLAPERDEPSSDTLDIADLPLDNQEAESLKVSEPCQCLEKTCVETEDEVGDIANDSCIEELPVVIHDVNDSQLCSDKSENISYEETEKLNKVESLDVENIPDEEGIESKDILESTNINDQYQNISETENETKMGGEGISCYEKTDTQYNKKHSTINELNNQPSSSKIYNVGEHTTDSLTNSELNLITKENPEITQDLTPVVNNHEGKSSAELKVPQPDNKDTSLEPCTDFKAILDNIKRQDEHLALKDQRLNRLESGCSDVITSVLSTLRTGDLISNKLETLHGEFIERYDGNPQASGSAIDTSNTTDNTREQSTSNELDHEAMFAARDVRLKRLEEQTKSLVSKVNKTATKGVKLNFKLEELHNIYGSETSRAGTPSEDNESNTRDDNENDEE